ncbi:MAG: NUDIX hydrolase [Candidatus Saccharimonadales bacterium]
MKSFVVSKVLVVNEKGEVLALRRSQTDERRPGQWDFPGGWVDAGEDTHKAAIREAKEEAGIELKDPELVFAFSEVDSKRGNGTWLLYIEHIFSEPTVTLSAEHDAYDWKKPEDLLKEITYDRQQKMLRYVLQNKLLEK